MNLKGKVHKFGDDVNTDEIIPARYLNTSDPKELAAHCMEDADPKFVKNAASGDIIVGGENFGCGSSREHAPIAIKAFGISCIIAKSFARIFYRNAINIGLPIFTSAEAAEELKSGDKVEVDASKGEILRSGKKKHFKSEVFPKFLNTMILSGGLMGYAKKNIKNLKN
jgi:3-isopropylmalate/(R)-2-methylmalate dehydratase small subunit